MSNPPSAITLLPRIRVHSRSFAVCVYEDPMRNGSETSRRGGIGRRAGLKIQYSQECVGSIPSAGSPSKEGTSESTAQPCAAHRERLTIQSATACNAFSPQGEWLDRRMSNQRLEEQRQFLQNRLSPEGYAGLHLTIGVLVVLLAGWWVGAIAQDLSPDHPLVLFDQRVAVWFHQHATTTLTNVAKAITFFGSTLGLTILSVAVALVCIVCRAW